MKNFYRFYLLIFAFFTSVNGDVIKFNIIATTDLHGELIASHNTGLIKLDSIVTVLRAKNPSFLVDCGDILQGNAISRINHGEIMIKALNIMNYDFIVAGNHDFDFGIDNFFEQWSKFKGTLLGANFRCSTLAIKNYEIIEKAGVKFGFIGIAERNLKHRLLPDKRLEFFDNDKSISLAIKELRKHNVDVIILLTHDGIYYRGGTLFSLVSKFPEIDLIIGGHTHQENSDTTIRGSYFIQAPPYAKGLVNAEISFDTTRKKVVKISSELHKPEKAQTIIDPKFNQLMTEWNNLTDLANKKINFNTETFIADYTLQENLSLYLMRQKVSDGDVYMNLLSNSANHKTYHINNLNAFALARLFPYEDHVQTIMVSNDELNLITTEIEKLANRYNYELFIHKNQYDSSKLIKLVTTTFILTGGANPESPIRKINSIEPISK